MYNEKAPRLGEKFFEDYRKTRKELSNFPHFQIVLGIFRQRLLSTFPHLVHYDINEDERSITIYGITHASRHPKGLEKET